jgi:hypothetical protein
LDAVARWRQVCYISVQSADLRQRPAAEAGFHFWRLATPACLDVLASPLASTRRSGYRLPTKQSPQDRP